MHTRDAGVCRWVGRVVGAVLVLILVLIAIGEGIPNPFTQPLRVQAGFLGLFMILLGIVTGWRWELSGGLLSLFGWSLFVAAVVTKPTGLNGFLIALAVPGLLYVASALLRRRREREHPLVPGNR